MPLSFLPMENTFYRALRALYYYIIILLYYTTHIREMGRTRMRRTRKRIGIGSIGKRSAPNAAPKILGIDPGLEGAFVLYDGKDFASFKMPTKKIGKKKEIVFEEVHGFLHALSVQHPGLHVYLERAAAFGMGSTGAFNYGRGFAMLEIALKLLDLTVTYVEPGKWTKEMHEGISKDLKPKAKSLVAIERLFPKLVPKLPRNTKGRLLEGPVDALLIAGYGYRRLAALMVSQIVMPDFF